MKQRLQLTYHGFGLDEIFSGEPMNLKGIEKTEKLKFMYHKNIFNANTIQNII